MAARFAYLAVDAKGREKRGSIDAGSEAEARAALEKRRLLPVRLTAGDKAAPAAGGGAKQIGLGRGKHFNAKARVLFTRQLATLIKVSPLEEALRTIARQSEKPEHRAVVNRVADQVVEGRRLADALGKEPKSFDPLYRAMVAAGESSGTLAEQLDRLAALQERQAQMRSKLLSALAYPAVLTLVAIGVVAALMIAVVPKVVEQFEDVGQQLPFITRVVIALSDFLSNYWWLLAALIVGTVAIVGAMLRNEQFRLKFDSWLLRLPFFGRLLRDLNAARMARTLATMVAARLPLVEGLAFTARTISNRRLAQATRAMEEEIRGGGSLSGALKRTGLFPPLLVHLTASGESAGQLGPMLSQAADYLEREFDTFTSSALALLEPLIIIIMGAVVAAIVLAILMPILQLQTLIG
ncbi:type II secretion system inner membrane protein GspF [Sphingomicrobium aestuariivivum]|uniref:type II secretion system inner membrane protein GspF n=1 Tax=Sphingomicrobium aestuariivivum TaxID=1582356 RepID=UPI001FD6CFAF|nr:type II secretion system inner membrane protein GspF [Sphingomicrobium aestuariivivum]MCJ8191271.1 type II secretion system inner membrane protein GspF [Sphingomicrobium aestuariivivum]